MLRKLIGKKALEVFGGKDCYCCCYRNPLVLPDYYGVWAGMAADEATCRNTCDDRPLIYSGYLSCMEDPLDCSSLSNAQLAERVIYRRQWSNTAWAEVDVEYLWRSGNAY